MAPHVATARKDALSLIQLALALAGAGVAGYLTWSKVRGEGLICIGFRGCDVVNNSPYAELLGIPVAAWGLGAYLVLAALALPFWGSHATLQTWTVAFSFAIALGGWLFSMYLTAVEAFVLHAWCSWCVTSAILITLLLGVCGFRLYRTLI
ncbi:vitamin K epoxide reductase family protein [Thermoflexus sp.]|uniref:vitamin K epoxide reductase family protein n=1 Tax=Thermoflexus sp. TaxID=1969742 RepID=UPI001771C427|nr:vitamin K epoxide reductase family protein [Thermoflexus sp.]